MYNVKRKIKPEHAGAVVSEVFRSSDHQRAGQAMVNYLFMNDVLEDGGDVEDIWDETDQWKVGEWFWANIVDMNS